MPSIPKRARLRDAARCRASHAALIERLRDSLAEGHGLRAAAAQVGLPLKKVQRLLAENESLREAYEQARDLRNELLADDAVVLADTLADASNAGLKLRIDVRKWRVSLDRKDGKSATTEKDKNAETLERLQRALERVRKREKQERDQRPAVEDKPYESDADERPGAT